MKNFIGFDNGVSGTIGIINDKGTFFFQTPVKKEQDYTKKNQKISRVDFSALGKKFFECLDVEQKVMVLLERPMVNPGRFRSTVSALRSLEATLIFFEENNFAFEYVDSKEWQRELLPKGLKGIELKHSSLDIGKRLFPEHTILIEKHKDADGLLIAEYCRRKYL